MDKKTPYIIIRPEGLPYEKEIIKEMKRGGFRCIRRKSFNNWYEFAEELYLPQFRNPDGTLEDGMKAWFITSKILFSTRARLIFLENDHALSFLKQLQRLKEIKKQFRKKHNGTKTFIEIYCTYNNKKHNIFCEYFHSPDPIMEKVNFEWLLLKKHNLV